LADGICKVIVCDPVAWYVISHCGYKYE